VNRPFPIAALFLVAVAGHAGAASRELEHLQVQVSTLQTQVSDLQRLAEDNQKELKRLNEQLAAQTAAYQKASQDRRVQDEQMQLSLKEMSERLGELNERLQPGVATASAPAPSFGAPPVNRDVSSSTSQPPLTPPSSAVAGTPPAPRELYSQAYADYARGNYDVSIQGFQEYLRAYPNTDFSDNAQYWIGECLYGKQKYAEAIEAWNTLIRDFPSSDKLPDGRFKKGLALERLGRRSQALIEYRYVSEHYPNSDAGRKAREKLNP
jgi:tol-pal system protein YbgF